MSTNMKPRIIRGQTTPEFHRITLKDKHFAELEPVSLTITYGKFLERPRSLTHAKNLGVHKKSNYV
jgi:hypothetical protein